MTRLLTLSAEPDTNQPAPNSSGTRTIALLNVFPRPSAHEGHTMRAIGLLVKAADGDAVNVISLDMLAPACASR